MVDYFNSVLPVLKEDKRIGLFAILRLDDLTTSWSILVSGQDLQEDSKRKKLFSDISDLLSRSLSQEERDDIARLGVFSSDNHLVKDVRKYTQGASIIDKKANGSFVHEGYILINKIPTI